MHSGVYTDLFKDYISHETEPCLQKMLHSAVTFTCSPVESWWSRTSERHRRGGERRASAGSTLNSRARAVNARYPEALLPTLKISVFVPSLMSLLLHAQDDVTPKSKLITFPSVSTVWAYSRLTSLAFLIQIPAHIHLVLFVFLIKKNSHTVAQSSPQTHPFSEPSKNVTLRLYHEWWNAKFWAWLCNIASCLKIYFLCNRLRIELSSPGRPRWCKNRASGTKWFGYI